MRQLKNGILWCFVAFFAVSLNSCKKESKSESASGNLIGKWKLTDAFSKVYKNNQLLAEMQDDDKFSGNDVYYEFTDDDGVKVSYVSEHYNESFTGRYSHVSGKSNTIMVSEDGGESREMVYKFIGNRLQLSFHEPVEPDEIDDVGYDNVHIFFVFSRVT